jgi:hypothetical protein
MPSLPLISILTSDVRSTCLSRRNLEIPRRISFPRPSDSAPIKELPVYLIFRFVVLELLESTVNRPGVRQKPAC